MKRIISFILLSCLATAQSSSGQKRVSTASLLNDLIDPVAITKWPDPFYRELQASSYDRKSVSPGKPGWFANADASKFIRSEEINNRKEYVMMDADGPGAIVRFL